MDIATQFAETIRNGRTLAHIDFRTLDYNIGNTLTFPQDRSKVNVVTSKVADAINVHRPVLDLDIEHDIFGSTFRMNVSTHIRCDKQALLDMLVDLKIATSAVIDKPLSNRWTDVVVIELAGNFTLLPSSTVGHAHLYLDTDLTWAQYTDLLWALASCRVVQQGWVDSAIKNGQSIARLPWIRKSS